MTALLDPRPSTLDPRPSTLDPRPQTLHPTPRPLLSNYHQSLMKITSVRTRVVQWKGPVTPLPPHFCTNPMDAIAPSLTPETMGTFTFHGWLICEIMTDAGLVGIGNAALSPTITKQVIDQYLAPLLIGA